MPAQAGIQRSAEFLDSRVRGNDEAPALYFASPIIFAVPV